MRAWSAVRSGRLIKHEARVPQTRDHSSSAVNRVLHDQAHALTGLLYDALWRHDSLLVNSVFWLQGRLYVASRWSITFGSLAWDSMERGMGNYD